MPALVAGIHVFLSTPKQGVDGRDKPGHDRIESPEHECYSAVTLRAAATMSSGVA
jgi:hypothetical protein